MPIPNIHILGIQGSGKGTQSLLLEEKYGLSHVSSGDLFRKKAGENIKFNTELAEGIASGRLMNDRHLFELINEYLKDTDIPQGFLGDGVIRTTKQYYYLQDLWSSYNLDTNPLLIALTLSEEIATERIKHRTREQEEVRTDDNLTAIKRRFSLYHSKTEPVIALFKEKGRCIEINADQEIEKIHTEICYNLEKSYPQLHHVTH